MNFVTWWNTLEQFIYIYMTDRRQQQNYTDNGHLNDYELEFCTLEKKNHVTILPTHRTWT